MFRYSAQFPFLKTKKNGNAINGKKKNKNQNLEFGLNFYPLAIIRGFVLMAESRTNMCWDLYSYIDEDQNKPNEREQVVLKRDQYHDLAPFLTRSELIHGSFEIDAVFFKYNVIRSSTVWRRLNWIAKHE